MILLISFLIGSFAAWRFTYDVTSCTRLIEEGKPDVCQPNSEGPFRLFDGVRWFLHLDIFPKWVHDGIECPYCTSFWASYFVAFFLPIYAGLSWGDSFRLWFVMGTGMSGLIAFAFRILQNFYGLDAREF